MKRIYFDNASTTPQEPRVTEKMYQVMKSNFGNPSSIHSHGRKSRALVEESRKTVANILNASIGEIFFTSSATEATNLIFRNCINHLGVKHIITSPTEHPCVLNTISDLALSTDLQVTYLTVDSAGNIDLAELIETLAKSTEKTMVTLMHGNNELGTVIDIKVIGELCKEHKALFHTDTVQTLGKMEIDVSQTYISFLVGSAHKFHGPKGSGFFYMNLDNMLPPLLFGGAQERNMRAGTENVSGIAGLAEALKICVDEMSQNRKHIDGLRSHFMNRLLGEFEDIKINGNKEEDYMYHVLSVSFPPTEKVDMLMFNLDISGISASSGSACSSGIEADSHVLVATGNSGERKTIRFSFSKYNTLDEVDTVIEKLKSMTPVLT